MWSQKPAKKPIGRAELGHSWARSGDVCVNVTLVVIKLGPENDQKGR